LSSRAGSTAAVEVAALRHSSDRNRRQDAIVGTFGDQVSRQHPLDLLIATSISGIAVCTLSLNCQIDVSRPAVLALDRHVSE